MDEDKKKILMIVIVVVCLASAGMILKSTLFPSRPKVSNKPIWLACINKACNSQYSLNRDEFQDLMKDSMQGPGMMMPMSQPKVTCNKCNKKSARVANKCVNEECGIVFIPAPKPGALPDKCPKCGTSAIEQGRLQNTK